MLVKDTREEPDPWETTWSAIATADAELSAAIYANDWPSWVRWLAGVESEEEALEWMSEEFEKLAASGDLTKQGLEASRYLSDLAQGSEENSSRNDWEEKYLEGVWSWERIAARRQYGSEPPQWLLEEEWDYLGVDRERAFLIAGGSAAWLLVFLVGLPFIPTALRCFKSENHQRLSPATRAWRPSSVTIRYIYTDILAGVLLIAFYRLTPRYWWDDFWGPMVLVSDTLWRVAGPVLLCVVLLIRWRHGLRLLGLHLKPAVKPILGMLSLGVVYDFILYHVTSQFTLSERLDLLYSNEDGAWGLLYAIVSAVILAPILEEVVFRGFLFQSYLRRFGFGLAMLFSTLFFVFIHFYGVYGSLSVAFFGIAACGLYRATGSLWTGIVFHAVTNGLIAATMWPVYYQW